jgi:hypothetical protein
MQSASLVAGMSNARPHIESATDRIDTAIAIVGKSPAKSQKCLASSR